jgi:signal transduction histidine kinase
VPRTAGISEWRAAHRPPLIDLVLAGLVTTAGVAEVAQGLIEPAWLWGSVIALTGALVLALRRRHPILLVAWLVVLQAALQGGADAEPVFYYLLGLVAAFSVAAHSTPVTGAGGVVAILASYAVYTARSEAPDSSIEDLIAGCVFLAIAAGLGFAVARSRRRAEHLQTRTARLVSEREAEARAAVADERARIARELHDAVAHDVSVIALQLGAVRRRLGDDQAREAEVLHGLERSSREAVDELRRIVGILREESANGDRSPRPTMTQLEALVEQVRDAGAPVTLEVAGEAIPLPPGIDVSAYRIIQEALANVLKHAQGARAEVTVTYAADELRIDIIDCGPGPRADGTAERLNGHGLVGMRERVGLFGGDVHTGGEPDGGFGVHARFPLVAVPRR